MTTYVTRQVRLQVTEEQNGQGVLISRGGKDIKFEDVAELNEGGLTKFVLPIPTVDQDLMEGETITTGRILYIETDTEMTIKLDDVGDTGFIVKPLVAADASTKRGTLYLEGTFTHVYASVAGASGNANVIMGIAGA
jgi:hypothetical protein